MMRCPRAVWLIACLLLSGSAGVCLAQPPDAIDSWQFRHDLFQLLLEEQQLRVSTSIPAALANPSSSVIVVADDTGSLAGVDMWDLARFVDQGGALLVARELSRPVMFSAPVISQSNLPRIGSFYLGPVEATREQDQYDSFADCIRITDIQNIDNLFSDVRMLITNRAGWFVPFGSNSWTWSTMARFPASVTPTDSRSQSLVALGRPRNDLGGLAIVVADSSLLTNGMLWHGDNGKFALRLSELLKGTSLKGSSLKGTSRERFVIIRNNQILGSATKRLAEQLNDEQARRSAENMPKPTWEQLLKLSNIVTKEVADSNVLNEALQRQPRHVRPVGYFRALSIILAVALTLWAVWRMMSSQNLREIWLPRRRQRFAYEIQSGNEVGDYRTAASYLAREFCIQWTGSHHSRDWQQALAVNMLRGPISAPADRHELARIVDIACRGCHERMQGTDFQKLGHTIQVLRRYIALPV